MTIRRSKGKVLHFAWRVALLSNRRLDEVNRMARKPLDPSETKQWLKGQRMAQEIIKRERVQFLLWLTPKKSLSEKSY
ncbi:MAG: hypothetical protein QXQ64_09200 [Candidatus Bathyarchaeia archaeon]